MAEGKLPNIAALAKRGGILPAADDALARVADRVGVVCHRRQRRQAQHLRLPRPRHDVLPAGSRDGDAHAAEVPVQLHPGLEAEADLDPRRHVVLGDGRARQGVRSDILTVPVTFPPEDVEHGFLLSGLPLPDIRGTMGTFSYYATDLSRYEEGNTEMGGILKRLVFEGDTASSELEGPPSPIVKQKIEAIRRKGPSLSDERSRAARRAAGRAGRAHPLHAQVEPRRRKRAAIDIDGQTHRARAGQVDAVDRSHLQGQLHRPAARHGADAAGERRQRAAALRVAGELQAGRAAGADLVAGGLLRRPLQGDRQLPHARLGRSDLGAERRAHGREDVHGRPHGRLRRPRARDPATASTPRTGIC